MAQTTTVLTEGIRDLEFLESEANGRLSRDLVTLTMDAEVYDAGTVLKVVSGKMVRFDGTGDAAGILMYKVDAAAADVQSTAIVRLAEVTKDRLVFASGVTSPQQDTAIAKLAESFIIAR